MTAAAGGPVRPWDRRVFLLGALCFAAVKLSFIVLFTAPSGGMPRLGADAAQYTWRGRMLVSRVDASAPALEAIRRVSVLPDDPPPKVVALRAQGRGQAMARTFSPYTIALGALVAAGFSLKWAYAALELATSVVLASGLACFCRALVGPGPAGLALVLLAGAIFPSHGIVDMPPAVMALGLGLLVWARALEGSRAGWLDLALGLAVVSVHEIGKVYLVAAIGAEVALFWRPGDERRSLSARPWLLGAALLISMTLLRVRLPLVAGEPNFARGEIAFSQLGMNWRAALGHLAALASANKLLLTVAVAGAACWPRLILQRRALVCWGLLAGALAASLFHGFYLRMEAELFSRLVTPVGIMLGAAAGAAFWRALGALPRLAKPALAALVAVHCVNSVRFCGWHMFAKLNSDSGILHDSTLEERLAELPDRTIVLCLEQYYVLMAALVHEGWRLPILPWPMLAGTASAQTVLSEHAPAVVLAPSFRWLNTAAFLNRRGLARHRDGFCFDDFDAVTIAGEGVRGKGLSVLVENLGPELSVVLRGPGTCQALSAPARTVAWLDIPAGCVRGGPVELGLPEGAAWLRGVRAGVPSERVHWPWGEKSVVVSGRVRHFDLLKRWLPSTDLRFDFSWRSLFSASGAEASLPLLKKPLRALSDDSGLVFVGAGPE